MTAVSHPALRALALRSAAMNQQHGLGKPPPVKTSPTPVAVAPRKRPVSQSVSQVANARVQQALAPQLANEQSQAQQQNAAIQAFAQQLLGKLQPIAGQVGADYNQAIGQTAALAGGAADALRNANPNQQDQQLLAALGAPDSQHAAVGNQLANTFGGGAAVTMVNQGQIPGTLLAQNKASSQAFANTLPATAALRGEQDLAAAMGQQRQDRQQILAQGPQMALTEEQNIRQNNAAKQAAAYKQYQFQTARADAYRAAGMKAQASAAQHQADLAYKYYAVGQENARTAASQAGQNARTQAQIDAANARAAAAAAKTGGKTGVKPPTANELNGWVTSFKNGKPVSVTKAQTDPKTGKAIVGANGKPITSTTTQAYGRLDYQQAYKRLRALGVQDVQARKALDTAYARGEQGRAWLTNEERQALRSAKMPAAAHRRNGHAYLDQSQVKAIKAAGLPLPPGKLVQGRTNTQDLGPIYMISSTY